VARTLRGRDRIAVNPNHVHRLKAIQRLADQNRRDIVETLLKLETGQMPAPVADKLDDDALFYGGQAGLSRQRLMLVRHAPAPSLSNVRRETIAQLRSTDVSAASCTSTSRYGLTARAIPTLAVI
jgi:hypothetical protein